MNNIKDLNVRSEILPLFDFTINDVAQDALMELLQHPLSAMADIAVRQAIIKGFIESLDTFKDYSYSRSDFYEVYRFLSHTEFKTYEKGLRIRLLISEKERHQTKASFIQLIVLFRRIHVYIKRINTGSFPGEYKNDLIRLNDFLASFDLEFYDEIRRENKFKTKHIIQLARVLSVRQEAGEISIFYKSFSIFEAYLSIAKGVDKHQFCFPAFSDNYFSIEKLFHPLIKNPVKNSFASRNNVILLSGPNMSGKSTFLKSIGICVYLAHLGMGVPASKAELPFFEHLTISIDHNDDLLNGYSHFMNELIRLKQVLEEANTDKKCFAVFDELYKGTNIEDAVQISSATIRGLIHFKSSFFFISTHLHQLKEMDEVRSGQVDTCFVDCDIENGTPVFNYQVKAGWSDLKVGQMLFEKEGLHELLQPRNINGTVYDSDICNSSTEAD
jgi:DNA mismatch repair protein MutS